MKISEMCSWCDKKAVLTCPDCGWEACEEHSREDGKCFYCTKHWEVDPKRVAQIEKMFEDAEKLGEQLKKDK